MQYFADLESHVGANLSVLRSLTYAVLSWFIIHISACVWHLIACHYWSNVRDGMHICNAPSWIYGGYYIEKNIIGSWPKPNQLFSLYNLTAMESPWNIYNGSFDHGLGKGHMDASDYVVINATIVQVYTYALYWSISTATTVGYDYEISSHSEELKERQTEYTHDRNWIVCLSDLFDCSNKGNAPELKRYLS